MSGALGRRARVTGLAFLGAIALSCSGGTQKDIFQSGGAAGQSVGGTSAGGSTGTSLGGSSMGGTTSPTPAGGAPNLGGGATLGGAPAQGGTASGGAPVTAGTAGTGGKAPATMLGDVSFSVPSQSFKGELQVGLSTSLASAEIRYTTDGSVPSATSQLYATPLALTGTTQLRAQAFSAGQPAGKLSTAIYIARNFDATSNLPIVLLDGYAKGKPPQKRQGVELDYMDVAVMVFEPKSGEAKLTELPTLATRAGYHVRGQSSASFPQTPYKVEFWDNEGKDADYPVMGLPADSDWALIPPYYDRTLVRNPFVYTLGKELGLEAPRSEYAEVYLNYEARPIAQSDYQGIYWFTETIKNNKVRTNLKELNEDDLTEPKVSGGYIFKFDQLAAEEPKLTCTGSNPISSGGFGNPRPQQMGGMMMTPGTCWTDLEVVDPDPLIMAQKDWLTAYIQRFHDGLHTMPMADYSATIDVASFVDYLIINELTLNVDAYVRSAYYHKDREGKLKAGPLWDYNFALGGVGAQNAAPQTTSDTGFRYSGTRNVNNWYQKLTSDPAFMQKVRARYDALRQTLLSEAAMNERVTKLSTPLTQAITRDFAKWPVADVIKSASGFTGGPTAPTWEGQIQVMRDFLKARVTFLDANLPGKN